MDLNELTIDNVGSWPWYIKAICILVALGFIVAMGFFVLIKPKLKDLQMVQVKQQETKDIFKLKQYKAGSINEYKKQLVEMHIVLKDMLNQLTTSKEIPALVNQISNIGTANGLKFNLIKPAKEVEHDFYAELPIEISVTGSYHDIAKFVSEISQLQKIVTFNDFTIKPAEQEKTKKPASDQLNQDDTSAAQELLVLDATARTYRYIEKKETEGGGE